jgi:hypothetical protein
MKLTKQQAIHELARRKGLLTQKQFRLEDYLFDKQLKFVLDPAPFKEATTTRRAGKSVSCVADLVHTAISFDNTICLYITLSRKNAKRLVWPEFKRINSLFNLQGEPNESDLSIRFPNGSMVYLLGASDRASIEDFRGLAIKKVYLDESQSFPAYIEQLIDDVLGPALMDFAGQLILIGTPGPIPSGYFYELTKNKNWSHHTWSFFDNPKLPFLLKGLTHQDMLDRELTRRGVDRNDPSILREWFGQWVVDENSLVYRYNKEINDYASLPTEGNWTYILGVDLGFNDADALAVLCYSDRTPQTYLVEEVVERRQDISTLCKQIDRLKGLYPISKIVVDTGGLGKKIAEEIGKRYTIPMQAAEKNRKVEYIELMNDALRTGRLLVKANSLFAHDAQKVEWDHDHSTPDKRVISKRFHSDICEAVLYAWRESYSYSYQPEAQRPIYGSKLWGDAETDKMYNATLARLQEAKEENGDDEDEFVAIDIDNLQDLDRPPLRYQARFNNKKMPPK